MAIYKICLTFELAYDYKSEDDKPITNNEELCNFDMTAYLNSLHPYDVANKFDSDVYFIIPNSARWIEYQQLSFSVDIRNIDDRHIDENYIKNILYDKYYEDEFFWTIKNIHQKNLVYKLDYRNEFTNIVKIEE
jgi:hypothetical protein